MGKRRVISGRCLGGPLLIQRLHRAHGPESEIPNAYMRDGPEPHRIGPRIDLRGKLVLGPRGEVESAALGIFVENPECAHDPRRKGAYRPAHLPGHCYLRAKCKVGMGVATCGRARKAGERGCGCLPGHPGACDA